MGVIEDRIFETEFGVTRAEAEALEREFNSVDSQTQSRIKKRISDRGLNPNAEGALLKELITLKGEFGDTSFGDIFTTIDEQDVADGGGVDDADVLGETEGLTTEEIEDVIERERVLGEQFITGEEERRKQRRSDLSGLLTTSREQAFSENAPEILESLSSRGLLRSSAVGEELAGEQSRLQQISENFLSTQALSDVDAISGFKQGALGREIDLRRKGKEREFSLEDFGREASLARELAQLGVSSSREQSKADLTGSIFDLLGQLGGGFLAGRK